MKKLVEESLTNVAKNQAATYGMQVYTDKEDEGNRVLNNLWPRALLMAEKGKVAHKELRQAGNCIRETTGWTDPTDSLLVYAYIARSKTHETLVD